MSDADLGFNGSKAVRTWDSAAPQQIMNTYSAQKLLAALSSPCQQRGLQASRSHQLQTERNEKQLQKIFRKFDLNGDGELTTKEFVCALKSMNPQLSDHAVRVAARQVDVDGDGVVDYKEFTARLASDTQHLLRR